MPKSRVNKRGGRRVTRGGQKTRRLRHSKKRSLTKRRGHRRRRRRRRTRKGGVSNAVFDSRHRGALGETQDEFGLAGALAGVTLGAAESAVKWGHGRFKRRKPRTLGAIKRMRKGFHRSNIIIDNLSYTLDNGKFIIAWGENDKGIEYLGSGIITHQISPPIEGNDGYKISFISQARGPPGFTLTQDGAAQKGWPRNKITFSWGDEEAANEFYESIPPNFKTR